jgi:hypothetical protein
LADSKGQLRIRAPPGYLAPKAPSTRPIGA